MVLGQLDDYMQRNEAGHLPHTISKTLKAESINFLEENIGLNLCDLELSKYFSDLIHCTTTKGNQNMSPQNMHL